MKNAMLCATKKFIHKDFLKFFKAISTKEQLNLSQVSDDKKSF